MAFAQGQVAFQLWGAPVLLPAGWLDDPHGVTDDLSGAELGISGG